MFCVKISHVRLFHDDVPSRTSNLENQGFFKLEMVSVTNLVNSPDLSSMRLCLFFRSYKSILSDRRYISRRALGSTIRIVSVSHTKISLSWQILGREKKWIMNILSFSEKQNNKLWMLENFQIYIYATPITNR